MAIKKSELYSSLWAGCDELRGSMDASQYKDYVLVLLFMKYVTDKGGALVEIPKGGSFHDMSKLKRKSDIGTKINSIISALAKANDLTGIITVADFDDDEKLGSGKEKVDRLTKLIEIFENESLDFSGNNAEGDDILGDAYEYLMRHFATESGKSKGQFYTPAEVSRVIAKVIGIKASKSQTETVYDPTCGSGSLLLKAAAEAPKGISIYGQENDNATRALAVMNMWLHGNPSSDIRQGNTLSSPKFTNEKTGELKTFDYAVANPPFSNKSWMNGLDPKNDHYGRFEGYDNYPPNKNGDYAFLLHLVKSLKSKGKGAIVLPLGVLFRGNAESDIRKKIIQKGYIKGIIALPPNLFYGTGIAACIVVIDKENAEHRKGIFMIDAGKGYIKDGNKNRLRERDIHLIVDTFNTQVETKKYSRMIPLSEIADPKNDYNLNIPRYIDSQEPEDLQDIAAHLLGGIPDRDIEDLAQYWEVYPALKKNLFNPAKRKGYSSLAVTKDELRNTIFNHPEFISFSTEMDTLFVKWEKKTAVNAKALQKKCHPKQVISEISESILITYTGKKLTDRYAMYQHFMEYAAQTMQDDLYEIAADGWKAGNDVIRRAKVTRKTDKEGKEKEIRKEITGIEGLQGRLIPPQLLISVYFSKEQNAIDDLNAQSEALIAQMDELREEHGAEDGLLANAVDDKGKISKGSLSKALVASRHAVTQPGNAVTQSDDTEEYDMLSAYKKLIESEAEIQVKIKSALQALELLIIKKYPTLSIDEIKTIVVDKKWMAEIKERVKAEMDNISHRLTSRVKELAERYESPLPSLEKEVDSLSKKVNEHLKKMGFTYE